MFIRVQPPRGSPANWWRANMPFREGYGRLARERAAALLAFGESGASHGISSFTSRQHPGNLRADPRCGNAAAIVARVRATAAKRAAVLNGVDCGVHVWAARTKRSRRRRCSKRPRGDQRANSIIERLIASPMPVPSGFVVTKAVKISSAFGGRPTRCLRRTRARDRWHRVARRSWRRLMTSPCTTSDRTVQNRWPFPR